MAADVVLRARGPGGASPDVNAVGQGAGLVAEADGFEGKLPSTAGRRKGRLGLNLAGSRDGPARRSSCATGARAALCWAVRPSIVVPTSRNALGRIGPAVNSWGAAENPPRRATPVRSGTTPVAARRADRARRDTAAVFSRNSATSAGRCGGRRDRKGSTSLQTAARIWQGSTVNRCHGGVTGCGCGGRQAFRMVTPLQRAARRRPSARAAACRALDCRCR
ncbi:hypothetical protein SAMN05216360_11134 [Methylobacterium phyllostachyos]|uniref:Uncharacterized protein n=1 Tax=Methylobacterium phyllostachyos TaxID=582672 RepID=A0A1H0E389_9HYPH|nr:hypothetical protein SAMN05216360_11134 [Methylobacterium phyllostachyos]